MTYHTVNQIDISPVSPIRQMQQSMITNEVDRTLDATTQAKHTHAADEAVIDMLTTGYLTAADGIKNAPYQFIENVLTEMALKKTLTISSSVLSSVEVSSRSSRTHLPKKPSTRETSPTLWPLL